MTINAEQAVAATRKATGERSPVNVGVLGDKGFVVEFDNPNADEYDNLPYFVDAQTGEVRDLTIKEFHAMAGQLTPLGEVV